MRPAIKSDGSEYCEYASLYTDDTLVISEEPEKILRQNIGKYFQFQKESIGSPGDQMRKVFLDNGIKAQSFSSSQYVQTSVKKFEKYITKCGWKLSIDI